jgi:hypothetical protein
MSDELFGTVEHVEEIGVCWDTYLDEFIDEVNREFDATFSVFLVEAKAKWIGGFFVGVESIDEVLSPDVAVDRVVVEFPCVGDVLTGFVREGVVDDDDTVTALAGIVCLLEEFQPFFVQLVLIPVILREELVESPFALRWKHVFRDAVYGLVAASNKTSNVGLSVVFLPSRKALELVYWSGARQERRKWEHPIFRSLYALQHHNVRSQVT